MQHLFGVTGQPLVLDRINKESGSGQQNLAYIAVKISVPKGHKVSQSEIMGSIIVTSDAIN